MRAGFTILGTPLPLPKAGPDYKEVSDSMTTLRTPPRPRLAASSQYLRHTKIPTLMFRNASEADKHVALVVESLIRENNSAGVATALGLPTGSTPIGVYRELIRLHRAEGLDSSQVVT